MRRGEQRMTRKASGLDFILNVEVTESFGLGSNLHFSKNILEAARRLGQQRRLETILLPGLLCLLWRVYLAKTVLRAQRARTSRKGWRGKPWSHCSTCWE